MQRLLEVLYEIQELQPTQQPEMQLLGGGILSSINYAEAEGGEYLTKIDVFFQQKDENIPVTCQIREMQNGYPTTKVLPFASKSLAPFQDGTVAMSNGSSTVTGTNTNFFELRIGQVVTVYGAGNETNPTAMTTLGGANGNGALVTKIASIESATSMTLNATAKRRQWC